MAAGLFGLLDDVAALAKAAEHKEAPADADLTPTQRVLAAKGVGSIREMSPKLNA